MSNVNISKLFQSAEETVETEIAEIKGEIPSWLGPGVYCRVGPSKFDLGKDGFCINHLLDGYAMLTKFFISQDRVTLEKKYLQSDAYRRAIVAGKPVITEFATHGYPDPSKSLLSKFVTALVPEFTDNDYSTLYTIGSDLFSTADTCFFRKIDLKNLGQSEKQDTNKHFGLSSQSAHPLTDPVTGDFWNVGVTLFTGLKYHIIKVPAGSSQKCSSKEMLKNFTTIASIPSRWNGAIATMHSFGMSQNHVILIEQPYVASMSKMCTALIKKNAVKDWLDWRGDEKNRFIVVSKNGKVYKTEFYSNESFYYMHTINCFEEDNHIIVDMITYPSPSVLDIFYIETLRQNKINKSDFPQAQRFIIPLVDDVKLVEENVNLVKQGVSMEAKAVRQGNRIILTPELLIQEKGLELPCINRQERFGKKNKFWYASGTINVNSFRNKICKVNTETKEIIYFKENDYVFPGEPYFIPNPHPSGEEDDGVILAAMSDTRDNGQDFLLFLDKNMHEIARATFQQEIPNALHGIFLKE